MSTLDKLEIVLNTIAEQDLNNMLPISSYLIGLAFEKKGFHFQQGAKAEGYTNASYYTIQRGSREFGALVGVVVFEMFKRFKEQPEKTQQIVYDFFINKTLK